MRIHLQIQRNGLPSVSVLWPVDEDENGKKTLISRLVAKVDEAFPLETEEWALEDYILQVGGSECLHWQNVGDVLRDGDVVVIRPLDTPEMQQRRMLGRNQIDQNMGVHLHDGVPYGRPCLRKPIRPRIKIPPRKRRRVDFEEEVTPQAGEGEEDEQLLIENVDESEEQLALLNGGFASLKERSVEPKAKKVKLGNHIVRFEEVDLAVDLADEDEDDEEDDEEFAPDHFSLDESAPSAEGESSGDSSDSSSDSDLDSGSNSSSDSSSDSGSQDSSSIEVVKPKTVVAKLPNGANPTTPKTNGIKPLERTPVIQTPEGLGKTSTRDRNKRRKLSNLLNKLKEQNILPPDANAHDLEVYQAAQACAEARNGELISARSTKSTVQPGDVDMAESTGAGIDEEQSAEPAPLKETDTATAMKESEARLEAMRARVAAAINGNITSDPHARPDEEDQDEEGAPEEMSSKVPMEPLPKDLPAPTIAETTSPKTALPDTENVETSPKRARLDINGAQRHIFGSLGVRTPKTAEDAKKTRAKLVEQSTLKRPTSTTSDPTTTTTAWDDEPPESDAWRSRITLSAVECLQDGITNLSEPPYPFHQRWDPQQELTGKKWVKGMGKKKKRKGYFDESGYLNYDDHVDGGGDAEGGAVGEEGEEDLPLLPKDMGTLPDLKPADLQIGAIIAFKTLEMGPDTNWEPKVSGYMTGLVIAAPEGDASSGGAITLQLAKRDRKVAEVKYDDQGNRIYEKFEMDLAEEGCAACGVD
ncbi:hypothetical protein EJ08DRAFT_257761 [Tothia fuscella]|uniref:DUF7357 domain-containing protein n=1 Tax=Tothia fuscella TaxID=1048955 RepID=A0A9P4TX58_9PEZI|nr:hypothetical protein EJ08DRAFT_257761 [Tothia fuscella]